VLASTWALGSQKCKPITGIFTKKGNSKITEVIVEHPKEGKEKFSSVINKTKTKKGIDNILV